MEDNLLLRETFCEPAANNITHFPHTNFITNDLKLSSRNHLEDNGGKYDMKATGIVRRIEECVIIGQTA